MASFIDADGKIIVQYGNVGGKILTEKSTYLN